MKIVLQCGDPTKLIWASPTTFYFPERYILHPKLRIEFIDNLIRDMYVQEIYHKDMFQDNTVYIITNAIEIIARCRVAKKEKDIEELEVEFYPFDDKLAMRNLKCYDDGKLDGNPLNFMDDYIDQITKLI